MFEIESPNNPKIKFIKKLKDKKYRLKENLLLVEGPVVIEEILDLGIVKEIFIDREKREEILANYPRFFSSSLKKTLLSKSIFQSLQETAHSQGIIALVENPIIELKEDILKGRYIYLDGIQDPGNMGGIIRSCDAFSFDGILIGPESVDPTNPKVIRSSMASIFRSKIYFLSDDSLLRLLARGQKLFILDLKGHKNFNIAKEFKDFILVVGNEARGPRETIRHLADEFFTIPLSVNVNSLNANVAASIAMYELKGGD